MASVLQRKAMRRGILPAGLHFDQQIDDRNRTLRGEYALFRAGKNFVTSGRLQNFLQVPSSNTNLSAMRSAR
jgi:hypothetical protein